MLNAKSKNSGEYEMNKWFKSKFKFFVILGSFAIFILVGVVVASSIKKVGLSDSAYISQEISKAQFDSQQDFVLKVEQDDDALLKILDAKVKVISAAQYQTLTGQKTDLREVISVPQITLQNASNKTIVGITVIIEDKVENANGRGLYIKEQSIKPGQKFTIMSENFVRVDDNSAKNPKFWLTTKDKSQVVVRVVATFEDGSKWFNKNYGVK